MKCVTSYFNGKWGSSKGEMQIVIKIFVWPQSKGNGVKRGPGGKETQLVAHFKKKTDSFRSCRAMGNFKLSSIKMFVIILF